MSRLYRVAAIAVAIVFHFAYLACGPARGVTVSLDPASASLTGNRSPDDLFNNGLQPLTRDLGLQGAFPAGLYDDLNSVSFGNDFAIGPVFFSVDRNSVGLVDSAVRGQATGNGAAADVFQARIGVPGNTLWRTETALGLAAGFSGDDIDALEAQGQVDDETRIYFTLDPFSASVNSNTHTCGGHVIRPFDVLMSTSDAPCALFADGVATMGLSMTDQIDALAIYDGGRIGQIDPGIDTALYSLGMFSGGVLNGHWSAGDVIKTTFSGDSVLFASAASLGLQSNDNIDAIDTVSEPSSLALAMMAVGVVAMSRRARILVAARIMKQRG
jgi:hypothetical protein